MNQDRELDKYLQGQSGLSKLHAELPEVKLPEHLDAAILAEAHRAVGARPGKTGRRWTIPLGMVATLFVAVMIGLQLPNMLKDADQTQQLRQEKMAVLMEQRSAERASVEMGERKQAREMDKAKAEFSRHAAAPKAAAPALAEPRESMAGESELSGSVSVAATPAPARAAKSVELRERAEVGSSAAPAMEKKAAGQAATAVGDSVAQPAPAAATMAEPQPVQTKRSLSQNDANTNPEDWLRRIKKLKQEGKLEEAKKELVAFKKRYPDFSVPEALETR